MKAKEFITDPRNATLSMIELIEAYAEQQIKELKTKRNKAIGDLLGAKLEIAELEDTVVQFVIRAARKEQRIKELEENEEFLAVSLVRKVSQIKKLKEPEKVLGKYCEAECQRLQFNKQIKELELRNAKLEKRYKTLKDKNANKGRQITELEIDNKHLKQDLGATIRVNTQQIEKLKGGLKELIDLVNRNNMNVDYHITDLLK